MLVVGRLNATFWKATHSLLIALIHAILLQFYMPNPAASTTSPQSLDAFREVLREIFQYDVADLDFGIYRVLNEKRDDIERFIDEELVEAVHEELAAYEAGQVGALKQRVEEAEQAVRENVSDDAIEPDGSISKTYRDLDLKAITDYKEACKALEDASMAETTERRIYDDLTTFFRRYYEDGDFATKRRFAARKKPYYVPYDGQEVFLHWANRDQYYIKTTEHFTDYRFDVPGRGLSVHFELVEAQSPQDNNKASDDRYFVLTGEEPVTAENGDPVTCTIRLAYRPISEDEKDALVERYNQAAGESKSQLKRDMLCTALEKRILEHLEETGAPSGVRAALADPLGEDERSPLYKHLTRYTAKNTADYFVHKDLRGFLEGQLEFFIQNEVLELDDVLASGGKVVQQAVSRAQVVKKIGERIISFLAQIEDFQRRLFEKKKFITETGYCVTLDRVPEDLYDDILANDGQLAEWRELYTMDAWDETLEWQGDFDRAFIEAHPHVMIDTRHFGPGFTDALAGHLSTLDETEGLDGVVNGLCIEGDNFQALNLLQARYAGDVPCIYIDPPYNTGNDGFLYKDRYRHSSWLSMMADRLTLARGLMNDDALFFSSVGEEEHFRYRAIADELFDSSHHAGDLVWRARRSVDTRAKSGLSSDHEYILCYRGSETASLRGDEKDTDKFSNPDKDPRGQWRSADLTGLATKERRPNLHYDLVDPSTGVNYGCPPKGWRYEPSTMDKKIQEGRVLFPDDPEGRPRHKLFLDEMRSRYKNLSSIILKVSTSQGTREVNNILGGGAFSFPKPTKLVKILAEQVQQKAATYLDFFAGSGTLGHAVMNLNREDDGDRRYILVEMGEYFDTVLLPRLKKVAFSGDWKDGVPQSRGGQSHVIKYHRLESYEDALNNIEVEQPGEEQQALLLDFDDYELHYMLPHETRESQTLLAPGAFKKPFDYSLRLQHGMTSPEARPVDLVETFNYLIGLRIETRRAHEHQERRYVVVTGTVEQERGLEKVMVVWRNQEDLDLGAERTWAEETLPPASNFDRIYTNGPSHIADAEPIEGPFRQHMDPARSGAA